jgi:dihydroceramidase
MAWTSAHDVSRESYWGPVTSSLLWCEDKYRLTPYMAEPCNTLTNISFVALSLYGAYNARRERTGRRFVLAYAGVALVGVGSFFFHATLKYEAQLLDELPMIYTSLLLSYCILETSPQTSPIKRQDGKGGQLTFGETLAKGTGGPLLPLLLAGTAVLITVSYLALPNPVLHQVSYGAIQIATALRVLYLLYSSRSPLVSAPEQRERIRASYRFGAAVFIFGFVVWNIDNIFCEGLRVLRAKVGNVPGILFEGHAWWHILTGYGAYHLVCSASLLSLSLRVSPDAYTYANGGTWKGFLLPRVVRTPPTARKAQ